MNDFTGRISVSPISGKTVMYNPPGSHLFRDTLPFALDFAKKNNTSVHLTHNNFEIIVAPLSDPKKIFEVYMEQGEGLFLIDENAIATKRLN